MSSKMHGGNLKRYQIGLVSGMGPGPTGTGQLLRYVIDRIPELPLGNDVSISLLTPLSRGRQAAVAHQFRGILGSKAKRRLRSLLILWRNMRVRKFCHRMDAIVIFHPQSLGLRLTQAITKNQDGAVWLYLLDNSFFCAEGYNHVLGENQPCLRCIGTTGGPAEKFGCGRAWATHDAWTTYLGKLHRLAAAGKLRFLCQTESQKELVLEHFGPEAMAKVVGAWAADWPQHMTPMANRLIQGQFDVVFHGSDHHAKGGAWLLEVARRLPHVTFLFPYAAPPEAKNRTPSNCTFAPMSWTTGLAAHVETARVVITASLWQAPIEGALIKSIATTVPTAVVQVEGSFSASIPEGAVIRLSARPEEAAEQLGEQLAGVPKIDQHLAAEWLIQVARVSSEFVETIVTHVLLDLENRASP